MPLDSDIQDADSKLHVEFYDRKISPDVTEPYVRILIPGDKTSIIDQPAKEHHKKRFMRHWLAFQAKNGSTALIGMPLEQWHQERPGELTDGQLMELQILKFQTVEQVAQASDSQMQRVGMGGMGLRERARTFIASKNSQITGAAMNEQNAQIESLKQMVATLSAQLHAQPPVTAPKKRGPKPGFKRKGSSNDHHAPVGAAGHE